jgi:hypothetical protein
VPIPQEAFQPFAPSPTSVDITATIDVRKNDFKLESSKTTDI